MKKVILFFVVVLLASCNPNMRKDRLVSVDEAIENQENELVAYLYKYKGLKDKASNSIQRDELWQQREDSLVILQDSIGVFHNTVGKIKRISASDYGSSKILEFEIEIEPEQYFKIDLRCRYIFPLDSIATDSLYNQVKALSNYTTVYVDGAVAITSKLKPSNPSIGDKDLQFSYPDYNFNVAAISTTPLPDISPNLRSAIKKWRKSFESILRDSESKETEKTIEDFKVATEVLTPDENAYMARYIQACSGDLYRE